MIHPGRRGTERGGTDPHSRRTEDSRIIRNTFFLQFGAFIVSSMTSSVGALVDGVIIGQCLGVDSIAAFGVISPLMIAFALIGAVISTGSRNRFTRLLGYGRQEEALGIFSLSVVLSVGISLALVPVILLLAGPIAAAFWILAPQFAGLYIKDSPEAFEMSVQAVRCYALGMPLYGLNLIYLNYFQGIGRSRHASITAFLLEGAFLVLSAAALAGQVWDFCTRQGCDKRRRYLMTLSVEEMVKNVAEHGFRDGKRHSVNVRVLKKGDDYILRIRDDCLIFDPVKQLRLFSAEDRASHYGLRMITGLAKEVRYTCVLKLNNLVVRI